MSTKNTKKFDSIGAAIGHILLAKHLTQEEFGDLIGKDHTQISRWVNNKVTPSKRAIHHINNVLGMELYRDGDKWVIEGVTTENMLAENAIKYSKENHTDKDLTIRRLEAQVDILLDLIMKMRNQKNGDER